MRSLSWAQFRESLIGTLCCEREMDKKSEGQKHPERIEQVPVFVPAGETVEG